MDNRPRFITPKAAARHLCVARQTIYNLIERGDLRAVKVGGSYRIYLSDFKSYIQRNTVGEKEIGAGNV